MGFQAFFGGKDTEVLIADSMAASFAVFAAMTDALIEGGQLDPNIMLKHLGKENLGRDGTLPVADTLSFFMRRRMKDHIRQEKNRFRRIKNRAKRRDLIVERNPGVLPFGSTGQEYVVREWGSYFNIQSFEGI